MAVFYTPMIVDWADLKLSKSLYVRRNSYEYLKSLGVGVQSASSAFGAGRGLTAVFNEVYHPFKLCRVL